MGGALGGGGRLILGLVIVELSAVRGVCIVVGSVVRDGLRLGIAAVTGGKHAAGVGGDQGFAAAQVDQDPG